MQFPNVLFQEIYIQIIKIHTTNGENGKIVNTNGKEQGSSTRYSRYMRKKVLFIKTSSKEDNHKKMAMENKGKNTRITTNILK